VKNIKPSRKAKERRMGTRVGRREVGMVSKCDDRSGEERSDK